MKNFMILALGIALPTAANAVTVRFGGVFGSDAPVTAFSRPGARFAVNFDIARTFRNGGNQVLADYTLAGVTRTQNAFWNFGSGLANGQNFTFAPGEIFSPSGFSINFFATRDFYKPVEGNIVRLTQSSQLRDGYVLQTGLGISGVRRGSIVGASRIRFIESGPPPEPILNFGSLTTGDAGLAASRLGAFGDFQSPNPEPASWVMLIGGFGLVGAAMRRRQSPAAMAR